MMSPQSTHLPTEFDSDLDDDHESLAPNRVPVPPRSGDQPFRLIDFLGIDHITLKPFIERPQSVRWEGETTHRTPASRRVRRRLNARVEPYSGFKIKLRSYTVPEQGWKASVSFNPSHHPAWPDPWGACPLGLLDEVLDDVWHTVGHLITPLGSLRGTAVARIDVARDHLVSYPHQRTLISAWSRHEVPRATSRPLWHSPTGVPTNHSTGTKKQGMVRCYDHALKHGSPDGMFRVEVEAREHWARTYGPISVVDDITAATVEALFMDRYRYAGLHLPILHEEARLDRLYALAVGPDPCLTLGQLPRLVGHERLAAHGIVLPEGHSTRSQRRRVTALVGLHTEDRAARQVIRLDPHHDEPLAVAA